MSLRYGGKGRLTSQDDQPYMVGEEVALRVVALLLCSLRRRIGQRLVSTVQQHYVLSHTVAQSCIVLRWKALGSPVTSTMDQLIAEILTLTPQFFPTFHNVLRARLWVSLQFSDRINLLQTQGNVARGRSNHLRFAGEYGSTAFISPTFKGKRGFRKHYGY